jgi:hypothetical protein
MIAIASYKSSFNPVGPVAESVLFNNAASHSGCGDFCVSS